MTRETVTEKLTEIFQDHFDDEDIVLRDDLTSEDIEDWDSLQHVRLILEIEREFGIRFAAGEASELKNVGHLIQSVLDKQA